MKPFIPKNDGISGRAWETAEPRDLNSPDGRRSQNSDPRFAHLAAEIGPKETVAGRHTRIRYKDGKRIVYVDGVRQ